MEPVSEYRRKLDGRWFVVFANDSRMPRAHWVWLQTYPDDPILKGEVIHHKDEDKENDSPENLQKMTDPDHRSLHSGSGVKALNRWRKKNPEEAKKQSSKNASKLQERLANDPELYKKTCDNRRKVMQSEAYRKKMSEAQKRRWRKRKEKEVVPA